MAKKPTFDEVVAYATPLIRKIITESAPDAPREHQEEIQQEVFKRLWQAYATLDADGGWKSYVYNHCRGGVLDYMKFGKGFQESKWSLHGETKKGRAPKMTRRSDLTHDPEDEPDIDTALGAAGVFAEMVCDPVLINWALVARLSSKYEELHAFAKYLRGYSVEEIAPHFGLCRTRVSQLIQAFIGWFDDPDRADDPWFKQICFALGVCRHLGMAEIDQATMTHSGARMRMGWDLVPVDLDDLSEHHSLKEQASQMSLFDGQEEE
jgi:RNA polymerase sigma factor (sigma-70 family)